MNNKYFTPQIEDIRVGYELERAIVRLKPNHTSNNDTFIEGWYNTTILPLDFSLGWLNFIEKKLIRVPFLTREQIENEGWEYKETITYHDMVTKENLPDADKLIFTNRYLQKLGWKKGDNYIEIYSDYNDEGYYDSSNITNLFLGECPSINELRTICKLLKI